MVSQTPDNQIAALYAAIRNDAFAGLSRRELARKHRVRRRTVDDAMAAPSQLDQSNDPGVRARHTDLRAARFVADGPDRPAQWTGMAERIREQAAYAASGIGELPVAGSQLTAATLALIVAANAFDAAAALAVAAAKQLPDYVTAHELTDQMILQADELTEHIAALRTTHGSPTGDPEICRNDLSE
jgi:hypothetical protein